MLKFHVCVHIHIYTYHTNVHTYFILFSLIVFINLLKKGHIILYSEIQLLLYNCILAIIYTNIPRTTTLANRCFIFNEPLSLWFIYFTIMQPFINWFWCCRITKRIYKSLHQTWNPNYYKLSKFLIETFSMELGHNWSWLLKSSSS